MTGRPHRQDAPMAATLLAFDTSTERLSVVLSTPAGVQLADEPGGALASATLLPRIGAMLAAAGVAGDDLDAIAFGRGPGAFTGLRTSCAVAQGLAFGLGKPVLPIDSLLVVAEDARAQHAAATPGTGPGTEPGSVPNTAFDVGVVMDARMEQVYAAIYRWSAQDGAAPGWSVFDAPTLFTLSALAEAWQGRTPACIAGSALLAFGDRLVLPAAPRFPVEHRRAAALQRLTLAAWRAGEAVDGAFALPLYVRDKVALTTDERQAVR